MFKNVEKCEPDGNRPWSERPKALLTEGREGRGGGWSGGAGGREEEVWVRRDVYGFGAELRFTCNPLLLVIFNVFYVLPFYFVCLHFCVVLFSTFISCLVGLAVALDRGGGRPCLPLPMWWWWWALPLLVTLAMWWWYSNRDPDCTCQPWMTLKF